MAPNSSTLAWKIPWTGEPGRLQSMGLRRVGHDWTTLLSLFTFMHWRRKWQPTLVSCLENPRERGAWWAAVYRVAQSRTRLKWLSIAILSIFGGSGSSLVAASGSYSSLWCRSFSLWWLFLWQSPASIIVAHGLSCSLACEIFPDQRTNLCSLQWKADT